MPRRPTLELTALALVVGCGREAAPTSSAASAVPAVTAAGAATTPAPIVVIDDAHDLTKKGAPYTVAPSPALALDAAGHAFSRAKGSDKSVPDAVHLAHGRDYYRADWDRPGKLTLDAVSLSPLSSAGPFAGFVAGDKYQIAVGTEAASGPDGAMRFSAMWMATIEVASK